MISLAEHARRELTLAGDPKKTIDDYSNIVKAFEDANITGDSANALMPIIISLLNRQNLTPLTNDPDEWVEIVDGLWQNIRNVDALSKDGGTTYRLLSAPGSAIIATSAPEIFNPTHVTPPGKPG